MVIYEPKGKAGEYAPWAVNLYTGCGHGCTYCYSPPILRMSMEEFTQNPKPKKDILQKLSKDAAAMAGKIDQVLLSFTSDPYQPIEKDLKITRQAIEILKSNGITINILTKGGELSTRDFDLLDPSDQYGVTLTLAHKPDSLEWEPGAAIPEERIAALIKAKEKGIKTWVSLEPVLHPPTALYFIQELADYVDIWKVGKLNYHPLEKEINWRDFATNARDALESVNAEYILKKDLKAYLR